jgi:hypothetical protein
MLVRPQPLRAADIPHITPSPAAPRLRPERKSAINLHCKAAHEIGLFCFHGQFFMTASWPVTRIGDYRRARWGVAYATIEPKWFGKYFLNQHQPQSC